MRSLVLTLITFSLPIFSELLEKLNLGHSLHPSSLEVQTRTQVNIKFYAWSPPNPLTFNLHVLPPQPGVAAVIQRLQGALDAADADKGTSELQIFLGPEFLIGRSGPIESMWTDQEFNEFRTQLKALSMNYPNFLIIPGSLVFAETKLSGDLWDAFRAIRSVLIGDSTYVFNCAPVVMNGVERIVHCKTDDGGSKGVEGDVFDVTKRPVADRKGVWKIKLGTGNLYFGMEICADHGLNLLNQKAQTRRLAGKQEIDIQLSIFNPGGFLGQPATKDGGLVLSNQQKSGVLFTVARTTVDAATATPVDNRAALGGDGLFTWPLVPYVS